MKRQQDRNFITAEQREKLSSGNLLEVYKMLFRLLDDEILGKIPKEWIATYKESHKERKFHI